MSSVMAVGSADFEEKVIKSDRPTLVDFWAEWCGPCRSLAPILDEVAKEVGDSAQIVKINVDDNNDLAQQFGVRGIPTMIFFKGGEVFKTFVGVQSKEEIKKVFEEISQAKE